MADPGIRSSAARLAVPKAASISGIVFWYGLILFFVAVAVFNLFSFRSMPTIALVASVIWLLLVLSAIWSVAWDEGLVQLAMNQLGSFTYRQFVWVEHPEGNSPTTVCHGFEMFARKFCYWRIQESQIQSVSWGTGQATSMAGRDMDDWQVWLWCCHADGSPRLFSIGRNGPRADVEAFGLSLVTFLKESGVELVSTTDSTSFVSARLQKDEAVCSETAKPR